MGTEKSKEREQNKRRAKAKEDEGRFARYKLACDSVIKTYRDLKFSTPISKYSTLGTDLNTSLKAQDYAKTKGGACISPAAASPIDFIVDVENVLGPFEDKMFWQLFLNVHVLDVMSILDVPKDVQHVFNNYEQKIGAEFISRRMFPVRKYFTTTRGK